MSRPRILLVEDDADLLQLTCAVLTASADVVDCVANTPEAMRRIVNSGYDLLITDLNINDVGDGLLLTGAMRHLQPAARRVLMTGYPDFPRGLSAIQATVDQVLLKPVEPDQLTALCAEEPCPRVAKVGIQLSVWDLMTRERKYLANQWLALVEQDPELEKVRMAKQDRLDHIDFIISGLTQSAMPGKEVRHSAEQHGHQRRAAGYRPEWILTEFSYLRRAMIECVLRNLLILNLSSLPRDFFEIDLRIDTQLLSSLHAFGLQHGLE